MTLRIPSSAEGGRNIIRVEGQLTAKDTSILEAECRSGGFPLRLDPFERMSFDEESFMSFEQSYGPNFWRFVFMHEELAKLAQSAIDCPPMKASAGFNLDALKKKIAAPMNGHGQ
jgi:hypothetical protein